MAEDPKTRPDGERPEGEEKPPALAVLLLVLAPFLLMALLALLLRWIRS